MNQDYENDYNAFDADVAPGGLRNTTEIKVILCYLVTAMKEPVPESLLKEALSEHNLANYFEISQALSELIDNGNLEYTEDGNVSVTSKTAFLLRELENTLPKSVREISLADATALHLKQKNGRNNTAEIIERDDGYDVVCRILHKEKVLMEIKIYAADIDQARTISDNFEKNPTEIYSRLISGLCV